MLFQCSSLFMSSAFVILYGIIFRGRYQAAKDISNRYPFSQFWDSSEPRLIVCEVKRLSGTEATKGSVMQEVS